MSESKSLLHFLSDPRLALYATSGVPVWLWSADATRILWGNPTAAAIFNAASPAALSGHVIDPKGSAALQIARLAGTLPHGASPRLERLRGFGGRLGGALLCNCARIMLADRTPAILVVATEAAGPKLSLGDQAKRLLANIDDAVAVFLPDGALLYATVAAQELLGRDTSLAALDAMPLAATAQAAGKASGTIDGGTISLERIGMDTSALLLATLTRSEQPVAAEAAPPLLPPAPDLKTEAPAAAPLSVVEPAVTTAPAQAEAPVAPAAPEIVPPHPAGESEHTAGAAGVSASEKPQEKPQDKPQAPPPVAVLRRASDRRPPLRFVWQIDADGRFTITSDEFIRLIGPHTAAALGRPWNDIAATLALDPDGHVARALASRDTWSGVTVSFPADDSAIRIEAELSGLPVFDRDRNLRGYRGFGVCRDVTRIDELARLRAAPAASPFASTPPRVEPPIFREPVSREEPAAPAQPENVVPFPAAPAEPTPTLSPVERKAFSELASRLTARLRGSREAIQSEPPSAASAPAEPAEPQPERPPAAPSVVPRVAPGDQRPILDRLPVGVLVYRLDKLIYANRAFLDWTGYGALDALEEAGGLDALFVEPNEDEQSANNGAKSLTIATNKGDQVPVKARLFTSPWNGESALVLMLTGAGAEVGAKNFEAALQQAKAEANELRTILDTAAGGVVLIDGNGQIVSLNSSAEVLFGYESRELAGLPFASLLTRDSQNIALDILRRADSAAEPVARDVIGRRAGGDEFPVFMTLGALPDGNKRCAIFRDLTLWKKAEDELLAAKKEAERASLQKSDFLAKISHEIRTPLNAMIGLSEVMMQERFGPIGNDRYRQYLKDIHASGGHLVALLNDLLDLSKIEAGKLELNFSRIDLNELTQQCVSLMQPQANRERVIIRTSLPHDLPQVTADARSVRQIVLNLLSNSIKFTGAGGQVIVSTALGDDRGDERAVVLRVRDTGAGMSEKDLEAAMEPFRQLATSSRFGSGGTGLGLPLTKALAEANRARFKIRSGVSTGTLVEVAFPGAQLAAE
ncbi:MAG: PAS domain S-box protein [Xanthobacteraceae bacterium]|nr:PAS domain S-box protein [Xanthobacteraceae bacterium]